MRKRYSLLLALAAVTGIAKAQSFSDNFDSYTANAYLGVSNSAWTTWTNKPGGADDVRISNAKAYSGNNSLYFTSTQASGGPSDVVLPFGGSEIKSGNFSLSMRLFVETQKKAYFNIQEQVTLGKGWTIDFNFDSLGNYNLVNTISGMLLKGTYTQNAWIKITLEADLNTNTWNFKINDVLQGSFQNGYRKLSSMDIYPTFNSSFYIDDVSYSITPYTSSGLNASVTFIDKVAGKLAGQSTVPQVEIRNLGQTSIQSVEVEVTCGSSSISKTVTGLTLANEGLYTIIMNDPIILAQGSQSVTATIKKVNGGNDDYNADNTKSLQITPIVPAPGKLVVAEEATGTWCSWCPRGAVWLKNMDERYPGYIAGIAVHNNDPMRDYNYDGGMKTKISGYPSMLVDRGTDIDPSGMEADFFDRIIVPPVVMVRNGAEYNSTTRELKISVTSKFVTAVSGNYKVAMVIVEDSVTGSGTGWSQANAYAGGSNGVMGGFEKLPNPVPASQMVYDHVGRLIYPNFSGLTNSFPATIQANDSFTHNFTVTLDPTWKDNKIHIVGMVIAPNGKVDNAGRASIDEAVKNGLVQGTMVNGISVNEVKGGIRLYPNPASEQLTIELPKGEKAEQLMIYSVEGKLIYNGSHIQNSVNIDVSNWNTGTYIGVLKNENEIRQFKFIKGN